MEKLTEPINIYFEGSKEKGPFYRDQLIARGYKLSKHQDYCDENSIYFNYPGTYKIINVCKESDTSKLVKERAVHVDNLVRIFKPFDKVIGIHVKIQGCKWMADLYSHYDELLGKHVCIGSDYEEVLPFEGNEDKVGKTEDEYLESMPF